MENMKVTNPLKPTPSSPVKNFQLILHKSDNQHKHYSRLDIRQDVFIFFHF